MNMYNKTVVKLNGQFVFKICGFKILYEDIYWENYMFHVFSSDKFCIQMMPDKFVI